MSSSLPDDINALKRLLAEQEALNRALQEKLNEREREIDVPELLPITLDAEDVVPTTSPRSQPVAAATPESLNISCEVTFRHGSLRLNGAISENILNLLIRELKR